MTTQTAEFTFTYDETRQHFSEGHDIEMPEDEEDFSWEEFKSVAEELMTIHDYDEMGVIEHLADIGISQWGEGEEHEPEPEHPLGWQDKSANTNFRKTLETFTKPEIFTRLFTNKKVALFVNPHYTIQEVPVSDDDWEDKVTQIHEWGNQAGKEFIMYLLSKNLKVNGKEGQWSCGFLGSRWLDKKLAGIFTRVCFYSKKENPDAWKDCPPAMADMDYCLMMDPHSHFEFK